MPSSSLYHCGGTGSSLFVQRRRSDGGFEPKITGDTAQRIHDNADVSCVSAFSQGRGEWIIHVRTGAGKTIPHRQNGEYDYLVEECERLVGRGNLTILYC